MKLHAVLNVLRSLAPEHLAEPWDHVGLQVGDPAWPVRKALLCIDLTDDVFREAVGLGVTLIVAYHPPIFSPLAAVTSLDPKQRLILALARRRIAVYSPHTALDAAGDGVNDWLCQGIGSGRREPIRPWSPSGPGPYKVVTFVPPAHVDSLRGAMADAGAGSIGDYSDCSFTCVGQGTFLGGSSTQPAVGQRGRLERVEEWRLEMVCPADHLHQVIDALRRAHPYEEPAFDVLRLESVAAPEAVGQGRIVTLDRSVTPATVIKRIQEHLGVRVVEVAQPDGLRSVRRVGLCAGAGGSLLAQAGRIDAFITGEMRHHDVLAARQAGVMVLLAGHTQTERPYLKTYRRRLIQSGGKAVDWVVSRADRPPSRLRSR